MESGDQEIVEPAGSENGVTVENLHIDSDGPNAEEEPQSLESNGGSEIKDSVPDEASEVNGKAIKNGPSLEDLQAQLEQTQKERDEANVKLEAIIGKLSGMKSVFQNYKATQQELDELKEQSSQWKSEKKELEDENAELKNSVKMLSEELKNLNGECDRLSNQDSILRRELQARDQEFQDEKYNLENELKAAQKAANGQKTEYSELKLAKEELEMENRNLLSTIDELKTKLAEKDEDIAKQGRKAEELKTDYEEKLDALRKDLDSLAKKEEELKTATQNEQEEKQKLQEKLELVQEDLRRATAEASDVLKLKEEIHSKSLIIGKLRHEAIILNEHLTKSLGMLKQQLNNEDNTIDKELISNVLLNFLQIPRGDTKKFEALQLMSVLLEWDEQRKVQAGLTLGPNVKARDGESRARNFVSLWTDFLEKESTKGNTSK